MARPEGASWRRRLVFLGDRIIVLFMGVGVGAAIALAFVGGGAIRLTPPPPAPPPLSAQAAAAAASARVAAAQAGPDCALPFAPRLLARIAKGRPATIAVFGDSFGDGLWTALQSLMARDRVEVLKASQEGVGFTRYQMLDLEAAETARLRAEPVDIAVIIIGANDAQGLFDDAGRHAYALMTPGWKAVYGARIDRFVGRLRDQGAMVYWLGLPTMRRPDYDRDMAALEGFIAGRMAALGVPFLSTRALSADRRGRYSLYLSDAGGEATQRLRANDGVHMTFAGYQRLARPVAARIRDYLARAAGAADAGPPALLAREDDRP